MIRMGRMMMMMATTATTMMTKRMTHLTMYCIDGASIVLAMMQID